MITCNLIVLAAKRRVSALKVARDTGISKPTIYALRNNKFEGVTNRTIETLCKYFDCSVGDLFEVTEEEQHE